MRWLVELREGHREDIGRFEDVGADSVQIQDGCLVFKVKNKVNFIRAAGTWATCTPQEEDE